MRVTLWIISLMALSMMLQSSSMALEPIPDRTVVLTFDDNVRSHLNFVAPLLKEKGFGATFFVTHKWMDDPENFLNWEEIAKLDQMGFEIGNHSWTHPGFNTPRNAAHLESELSLVDRELSRVKIEKPITFAWTGNAFSPEARKVLQDHGILFARRGMQPEVPYGELNLGPLYDPTKHDPLLIPSAGDAYPNLTLDHFVSVVERAKDGKIAVCQFHG
ncbi:MAG: polysaccharide deacetylase family protein, partial [Candidatus Omnitrophica bacterium]|nr:polysaccharide deacetylase family protein [Candidatus Omnitrophota bacterium]